MAGTKKKSAAKAKKTAKQQKSSLDAAKIDIQAIEDRETADKEEIIRRLYEIADISSEKWLAILKSDSWKGVSVAADSFQRAMFSCGQIEARLAGTAGLFEGDIHLKWKPLKDAKKKDEDAD